MLITSKVITKWNSKTKSYYESLGYTFTKMGNLLEIRVEHLKENSGETIFIQCDYCLREFSCKVSDRNKNLSNSPIKKDSCSKCKHLKAKESDELIYGVENPMFIEGVLEKRTSTILLKYGTDNVFRLPEVKERIAETNNAKYGNRSFTRTLLYEEKRKATCLSRYGVDSHTKTKKYRDSVSGKNSPHWKGGINHPNWERLSPKYKEWRTAIFYRDLFTCQKCLKKGNRVEAHHILNWKDNPEKRYDVENGITFCAKCHSSFHSKYGKKNTTLFQVIEFLSLT